MYVYAERVGVANCVYMSVCVHMSLYVFFVYVCVCVSEICPLPSPPQTEGNGEVVTHYLVKWRSLPYEDATWELEEDVDGESIRRFNHLQMLPPEDQLEVSGTQVSCDIEFQWGIYFAMVQSVVGPTKN